MISRHCKLNLAILSTLTATFGSTHAYAQIEEIIVTSTKRAVSSQDIPVSVMALSGGDLDRLNVDSFTDYLKELPGVTAGGSGPGQSTIYIRGLASTTPNLTTAGVAGLAPNVAFYLDEQPLAQPGRNLDVYAVDMARIEVLPGPQGTLFGASSQAGTIRLITNQPVLNEFQVKACRLTPIVRDFNRPLISPMLTFLKLIMPDWSRKISTTPPIRVFASAPIGRSMPIGL